MLVPAIAAANTLVFAVSNSPRHRFVVVALGVLPIVLPLALEWLGVVPPSYAFTEQGLVILPRMAGLPALPTLVLLVLGSIGKGRLQTAFASSVKAIEARHNGAR